MQVAEELEEVLEQLLCGLRDKDTVVRWSAAKGGWVGGRKGGVGGKSHSRVGGRKEKVKKGGGEPQPSRRQ